MARKVAKPPAMLTISTLRKPKVRIRGLVAGLMATLPRKSSSTSRPARTGDQPNPTWNISGSRKGTALITIR